MSADGRLRGTGPRRLIADRYLRVWQMVEMIAAEPGLQRQSLARKLNLAERTVQADLRLIRADLGLPLARDAGYLFAGHDRDAVQLGTNDLLALAALLADERHRLLAARLAELFPPHLRPLSRLLLTDQDREQARLGAVLLTAARDGIAVRVRYHVGREPWASPVPVVRPLLVLRILGRWHLLADLDASRRRLIPLDAIASAEPYAAERVWRAPRRAS